MKEGTILPQFSSPQALIFIKILCKQNYDLFGPYLLCVVLSSCDQHGPVWEGCRCVLLSRCGHGGNRHPRGAVISIACIGDALDTAHVM